MRSRVMPRGLIRRRCADCGVEVEVNRPDRPMGPHTTRNQRALFAREIRSQVLWEAIQACRSCCDFWNEVAERALAGSDFAGSVRQAQ